MQAMNEFHWAQDKIDEVVTGKKDREKQACERRLRQMQARREKQLNKQLSSPQPSMTETESNEQKE